MNKLTDKQEYILQVLKQLIAKNGYSPSIREIAAAANLHSPSTIHSHLKNLEEKGFIKKDSSKTRTIELLVPNEFEEKEYTVIDVPLLDTSSNSNLFEIIKKPKQYLSLPAYLINNENDVFALKAWDDSMINVGIYDNDILIIEKSDTIQNKDIVIAKDNDNIVTVKRFYKENGYFRLQPENDTMKPIILEKVEILGKVIGLYRTFKN